MKRLWLSGALLLTGVALSACGGGGSDSGGTATVTPPPAPTAFADRFGAGFGSAFRVSANAEAVPVADGNVDPVNVAAEPLQLQ